MVSTDLKKVIQEYDNFIKEFMEGLGSMTYPQRIAAEAGVITVTLFLEKIATQKLLVPVHEKYHLDFDKLLGEKWKTTA